MIMVIIFNRSNPKLDQSESISLDLGSKEMNQSNYSKVPKVMPARYIYMVQNK